jgi:hypothetical protein
LRIGVKWYGRAGMRVDGAPPDELSRRELIKRGGLLGGVAILSAQLPAFIAQQGWLEKAEAQTPDVIRDTFNGLVAFVVPGPDEYSVAQGESSPTPGGIAAGGPATVMALFDGYVPLASTGLNLPASGAVALLLNETALLVNPGSAAGTFAAPFSNLAFAEKIEVMRRLEELTESLAQAELAGISAGEFRFVSGILIGAAGYFTMTEGNAAGPEPGTLVGEPVAWQLTKYDGLAEGRDDIVGYYQGRRKVRTADRYRRHGRRRGRADA